jgi:hypothetical protein
LVPPTSAENVTFLVEDLACSVILFFSLRL